MDESSTQSSSEARVVFFAILVMVFGVGGLFYWQIQTGTAEVVSAVAPETAPAFDASEVLDPIVKRISDGDGARAKMMMEIGSLRAQMEKDAMDSESRSRKVLDDFELNLAGSGAGLKSEVESLVQANASMQAQIKELRIRNESLEVQIEELYDAAEEAVELADALADDQEFVAGVAIDEAEFEIMTAQGEPEIMTLPIARDPNEIDSKVMSSVRVVDADEKLNYVVLDVGEEDGVRPQMVFKVLHGDQVTATLRVKDVRSELTGTDVEELSGDGSFPQTGDRVVLGSTAN
jgi:hypothetical protein